jgi:hypothetical protein
MKRICVFAGSNSGLQTAVRTLSDESELRPAPRSAHPTLTIPWEPAQHSAAKPSLGWKDSDPASAMPIVLNIYSNVCHKYMLSEQFAESWLLRPDRHVGTGRRRGPLRRRNPVSMANRNMITA